MTTIVWFRQDLRLHDNPALAAAVARGRVIPVFILDDSDKTWRPGAASLWWLHHSLTALREQLGALSFYRGDPKTILPMLVAEGRAAAVVWNRCYDPHAIARDTAIKERLKKDGVTAESFNAALLVEPWDIKTGGGGPYKVFTPYWRAAQAHGFAAPVAKPKNIDADGLASSDKLSDWKLLPARPNWAAGFAEQWTPGEHGALDRFDHFVSNDLATYSAMRDRPDKLSTSRLSPHLHFGEISPRQIHARLAAYQEDRVKSASIAKFMSEIGWREFAHHLLYHFPTLPDANWRPAFDAYPWRSNTTDLNAWQRGATGYPLVDAGMRELWTTGFMHNRVRMIAASFLIKHLRLDWRLGEQWFWDTLVDADLANNAAGWQWVAGSGADASPYFRIFNPVAQGEKFDPDGGYVRRWCPELSKLPDKFIHAPWKADADTLKAARVILGETYPKPIVDHDEARKAALDGYKKVRNSG
ncbi:cryptochrome/photolyase family protein [Undibacter mobilis]|uniref:Deoxyribodipyrimidine photo-lyase n=1 Tax=Undibacter mobilis TaxID=2292256 RepID=A0A371BDD1_9BRAD|nr:deoxyribodipyrimidine photo-lyase [Undibacter mobilis]RDV05599.1 deoxyribodipyrimidine photo-lyase [Undibacter mobilis]